MIAVGSEVKEFLVYVQWFDGPGGQTLCETLEEAQTKVAELQRLGYDKPNCPIVILERTLKRHR